MKLNLNIVKSQFARNVITLITGTAIAQAIPVAISPILTRIYSPEDFGVFALYLSITSVISVVATGRYELAINLTSKDEDAIQVLWLSCILTIITSLITLIIIVFFNESITKLLKNDQISNWLYFIPLTVFSSGIYQSFNYWHNRKKKYALLSKSRVVQTLNTSAVNLGVGVVKKGGVGGLIFGNIIGVSLSAFYLIYYFFKRGEKNVHINKKQIYVLAKRYIDFPKYDVMASFFNISSYQVVHIFFNAFFGAVTSGYFFLTQKIFLLPLTLIAGSIQDVFRMKVIEMHINKGDTRSLYLKTLKRLILLPMVPAIFIYLYSVELFTFIFGEEWRIAGEYAKILTPAFFLRFITIPLGYMFYVVEKQKYNTIAQFLLLLVIMISFYIAKDYSAKIMVQILTIIYCAFYIGYTIMSYKFTTRGNINIKE